MKEQDNNMSLEFHTYVNRLSLRNKIARALWNIYSLVLFRTLPTKYCNWLRVLGLRLFGAKLGCHGVSVHRTARIWAPWNLVMEDYTLIDRDCRVYNPDVITIKSETVISENVFLCTASHDVHSRGHELVTRPITFNGGNWVAADVIILPGVTVGEGVVVGAGSVVSKDIKPWMIVAGNPAREVGERSFNDYQY